MTFFGRNLLLLAAMVTALGSPGRLHAQDSAPAKPAQPVPNNAIALPPSKSPIDLFRELLAMDAAERRKYLANRSPESRKLIMAKVREYESMRADERELRLRATELHWYLLPLLRSPATNRAPELEVIPPQHRKLVEDRLQQWDKLAPDVQKDLLANEATLNYLTELNAGAKIETISPAKRQKLEAGIAQWRQLSVEQRRRLALHFNQFFELTPDEKDRALKTLPEAERHQLEKTLKTFGNLDPSQRAQCIRSFEKFAGMSVEERRQFLKNAERWKLMSPDERQSWRELVARLSLEPPIPPSLNRPPLPPLPKPAPKGAAQSGSRPLATNTN